MARAALTFTSCASFFIVFIHGCSGIPWQYEECEVGQSLISGSNVSYPVYNSNENDLYVMVRLDDPAGVWRAFHRSTKQFLVVDLGSVHIVTRVSTRGRHGENEFVREYTLDYSSDNKAWMEYTNKFGLPMIFKGNNDSENVAENTLRRPIMARYIKFKVIVANRAISMSVDVTGCSYEPDSLHTLNGGHIVYDVASPQSNSADVISLRFRTKHENGILFYGRDDGEFIDYILLELRQGELHLKIDLVLSASMSGLTEITGGRFLNDGLWHDVIFTRNETRAKLIVDQYEIDFKIKHRFIRFKPNGKIFIGGVDYLHSKGLSNSDHFNGCIDRFRYNGINMIAKAKSSESSYFFRGAVAFNCSLQPEDCYSLTTNTSSILYRVQIDSDIRVGFDFRTVDKDASLFRYHESNQSSIQLKIDADGFLTYIITYKDGVFTDTLRRVDKNDIQGYTDGIWHSFIMLINTTNINVTIDGYSRLTTKNISILNTGTELQFGYRGWQWSIPGFIGCLRNIEIGSESENRGKFERYNLVTTGPCVIKDRCIPNPCEHNSICRQDADTFFCDCGNTGYTGALCHISIHPLSCGVHSMNLKPWMLLKNITIDPDGSGPLNPFLIDCFSADILQHVETTISHDVLGPVTVDGYQEPNYYSRKIRYSTDLDGISEVIERSDTCRQFIIWRCNNSRLMMRPISLDNVFIEAYGYWVGRTNQNMYYWGDSAPGTHRCACGVSGSNACISYSSTCNCDSGESGTVDEGYLTQKQYLPVMELHFGDTGTLTDNKVGQYELGNLECRGDNLLNSAVTLRKKDATLKFAPFGAGKAGDIWFQFKTTATDGVLIHNIGETNETFLKIELKDGFVEFSYKHDVGYRAQVLDFKKNLSDNTWHTVHVERNIKQAYLQVDGLKAVSLDEPEDQIPRILELTKPMVVGATVDYRDGFVGCMRGLRVNGALVDMRGAVHNGQFTYGVQEGCVGKCNSNPCFNGGECLEGYSHYTCNCTNTPFTGKFCSKDVGVNMQINNMIHIDFEKLINYQPISLRKIQVGFKTKRKHGTLLQLRNGEEYMVLGINNAGGVKIFLDIGFERWEVNSDYYIDFADGHPHILTLTFDFQIVHLQVDEYIASYAYGWRFNMESLKIAKHLYIGNNDTLRSWDGFEGCIYRLQIDDIFPLKTLFEVPKPSYVTFTPNEQLVNATSCGQEEKTHAPEPDEVRVDKWVPDPSCGKPIPPPVVDRGGKHIEEGDLFFTFPRQEIVLNENTTGQLTMTCRVTSQNINDINYILIREETSANSQEFECLAMIKAEGKQSPMLYDRLNTSKMYDLSGTFDKTMATFPYLSVSMDLLNFTCDDIKGYVCEVGYKNSSTQTFETAATVGTILAVGDCACFPNGCELQEKLVAENSDDLGTGTRVGIALAIIGGIAIVIIVVVVVCKYRRQAQDMSNGVEATAGYSAIYKKNTE